jgi:two-component sensor histidine kinase
MMALHDLLSREAFWLNGNHGGRICVRVRRGADDMIELSVRDDVGGLPADFQFRPAPGLGMRILRALSQRLNATVEVRRLEPGAEFVLTAPREPRP